MAEAPMVVNISFAQTELDDLKFECRTVKTDDDDKPSSPKTRYGQRRKKRTSYSKPKLSNSVFNINIDVNGAEFKVPEFPQSNLKDLIRQSQKAKEEAEKDKAKEMFCANNFTIKPERTIPSALMLGDDNLLAELVAQATRPGNTEPMDTETNPVPQENGLINSLPVGGAEVSSLTEDKPQVVPKLSDEVNRQLFVALQMAVTFNRPSSVRILLEGGANPNFTSDWGSPLLTAIDVGLSEEIIHLLLDYGCDPNSARANASALHCAMAKGNLKVAEMLLSKGAKLAVTEDYWGATVLQHAAMFRKLESVQFILQRKSDPDFVNMEDHEGRTALYWAAVNGLSDMARILLDAGASPVNPDNDRVIQVMLKMFPWNDAMGELLMSRCDINSRGSEGNTMLHRACMEGKERVAKFLLNKGADVNAKNSEGSSPLMLAVAGQHRKPLLEVLTGQTSLDINATDEEGLTAVMLNAGSGYADPEYLAVLKQAGADIHQRDSRGRTALFHCFDYRKTCNGTFCWLVENGADLNTVTNEGESLLSVAANWNLPLSHDLYSWNFDMLAISKVTRNNGQTPLITALLQFDKTTAKSLIQTGCSLNGVYQWLQTDDGKTCFHDTRLAGLQRWLTVESRQAQSLQDFARNIVVGCLGNKVTSEKVKELGVPKVLESYVMPESFREGRKEYLESVWAV